MTGADFFIIVALLVLAWAGATRGVIKEFFELLIVTVGVLATTYCYGPVGDAIFRNTSVSPFLGSVISFTFFFLIFAFAFWVLAGRAEASANLPPGNGFNQLGGIACGFAKGVILVWMLLLAINQIPMTENGKAFFSRSYSVQTIASFTPFFDTVLELAGSSRTYNYLHPKLDKFKF